MLHRFEIHSALELSRKALSVRLPPRSLREAARWQLFLSSYFFLYKIVIGSMPASLNLTMVLYPPIYKEIHSGEAGIYFFINYSHSDNILNWDHSSSKIIINRTLRQQENCCDVSEINEGTSYCF